MHADGNYPGPDVSLLIHVISPPKSPICEHPSRRSAQGCSESTTSVSTCQFIYSKTLLLGTHFPFWLSDFFCIQSAQPSALGPLVCAHQRFWAEGDFNNFLASSTTSSRHPSPWTTTTTTDTTPTAPQPPTPDSPQDDEQLPPKKP